DAYRAGADGKAKMDILIRTLYSVLEDLLFLKSGTPDLLRNTDLQAELEKMASQIEFAWIVSATQRLGELETGMRRNLLRSLALDTFATSLER
ncbi:MAG: DNA polymerase III subunit delta', partial [Candidatus Korobacteraceae bacterium]